MFSVYISQAERYDKALVTAWRADMKGILIFAGLFSGSLTAFIIESYRTLAPDPGATTILILAQISRQLNGSTESGVAAISAEFIPPTSALICNGLWFTSLGLSLASAVIATLVEQWSRDYLNRSDMRPSPIERARICSYLYSGLKLFRMHAIVDLIPLLLHMSLLLFFAGLVAFLFPINSAMVVVAAAILAIVTFVYVALTIIPLFVANCPYRTPLSGVFWRIGQICAALSSTLRRHASCLSHSMGEVMLRRATAESTRRTERDKRALCWTLQSLTTEKELEPFVEAIPQVIWSPTPPVRRDKHDHLLQTLIDDSGVHLGGRIAALLRTCENGLLEESARQHRTVLCLKALLAFAMTAKVPNSLNFPFEPSTFIYLSTTCYPPAQPYIPALRACGVWSLFCTFITNVERLVATCDAEIGAGRDARIDLILPALQKAIQLHREYTRARDVCLLPQRSELDDLINDTYAFRTHALSQLRYLRQILQRLLDKRAPVQLDIFRRFLLDSARSECEPYSFEKATEILRPGDASASAASDNLGLTFRAIVNRFKQEETINHIDHVIGVYLPLLDSTVDDKSENHISDALISYINRRDLLEAILRVLRDCDVDQVWVRVTRRLSDRDQLDDVLTAIWRLCDLFLDPAFSQRLASIPLHRFVDTASRLPPVSQYTASVDTILRTVALYAAQSIHIPIVIANDPSTVESSLTELEYLSTTSWLPSIMEEDLEDPDLAPEASPFEIRTLHARLRRTRLALLTEFIGACTSYPLPYNAIQTLAHIGSVSYPIPSAAEPLELQVQFLQQLRAIVKPANEAILQTILECPFVITLQWTDDTAVRAMRTTLDKAMLHGQQLPIVLDTLNRLPPVEDADDISAWPGPPEIVHDE
ncbi:hypothetical protein DFH08DRAFT_760711 [Mycena albidolilacea]|uniref:DUF6535 domain-containing protein n=1 Tax=Mycena albidolilacea TaxID=1033008 RepID=A0AAD7F698_9AGAR|nr:hypothetical protein DFH08DRAFT_760711 [Mycena albidolilacea]